MKINIPDDVKFIIDKLESSGFEAYVVGGAIRDSLLGKVPHDYDIATSAKPDEMIEIFKHLHFTQTGIKHGTITVVLNNNGYEVTTFRIDGDYSDNRHPDSVEFVNDIVSDLARRDFTINAMAYSPKEGLIDPFDGEKDLQKKIIKCGRNPDERFKEDALRMMRAVRFSAQLGFTIHAETYGSIIRNAELINNVSNERIHDEIIKILMNKHPEEILKLHRCGLMKHIIPELDKCFDVKQNNEWHVFDVGTHIIMSLLDSYEDLDVRLALMLHDIGKPNVKTTDENGFDHFYEHENESYILASEWLREYKFDNNVIDNVSTLVLYHDYLAEPNKKTIKKLLNIVGEDLVEKLVYIRASDISAQNPKYFSRGDSEIRFICDTVGTILANQEAFQIKDLAIDGNDLIAMGFKQGKILGDTLRELMDVVLEHPEMNAKDILLEIAQNKISFLS